MFRYAFLFAAPAVGILYFIDHRIAGLVGIGAVLLSFVAIVFASGK